MTLLGITGGNLHLCQCLPNDLLIKVGQRLFPQMRFDVKLKEILVALARASAQRFFAPLAGMVEPQLEAVCEDLPRGGGLADPPGCPSISTHIEVEAIVPFDRIDSGGAVDGPGDGAPTGNEVGTCAPILETAGLPVH